MTEGVGLAELSGFNRYEITGPGAFDWLEGLTCSPLRAGPGKVSLCYFLTGKGNVNGEATIARLDEDRIWYGSAAMAELHDMDWLCEHLPDGSGIRIESLTNTHTALVVAGPRARDLMAVVAPRTSWNQQRFPWLSARRVFIGHIEAVVLAISYSGEQAFELHIENTQLHGAYDILLSAGRQFGLRHFGMYAIDSMRLEKGYGHWKADLLTEFNPFEAGLDRIVDLTKSFPGKEGLIAQASLGVRRRRVLVTIDSDRAPAHPGETFFCDGAACGTVTSAGWGYRVNRNLAMGYLDAELAAPGTRVEVYLLGEKACATVNNPCLFDPKNNIPRGIPFQ